MRMIGRAVMVVGLCLSLAACAVVSPYQPVAGSQAYWGKDTAFIGPVQEAPPEYHRINLGIATFTWWENNPYPFRSFMFCPATVWLDDVVGCMLIYNGVKIDWTYTDECWKVYKCDPRRYVYELRGYREEDPYSEQFAWVWTRERKDPCIVQAMARC